MTNTKTVSQALKTTYGSAVDAAALTSARDVSELLAAAQKADAIIARFDSMDSDDRWAISAAMDSAFEDLKSRCEQVLGFVPALVVRSL